MKYEVVEIRRDETPHQIDTQTTLIQAKVDQMTKYGWELIGSLINPTTGSTILLFGKEMAVYEKD